jgi:hypothetical protein
VRNSACTTTFFTASPRDSPNTACSNIASGSFAPTTYTTLVETYGHKYLTEGLSYSASAFLARALSQLAGEELIFGTLVPATGRWEYNGRTGGYEPKGTSGSDPCLSWEQFAGHTLGINPEEWPPLADWTKPAPPAI